jgi:hypothetical protein
VACPTGRGRRSARLKEGGRGCGASPAGEAVGVKRRRSGCAARRDGIGRARESTLGSARAPATTLGERRDVSAKAAGAARRREAECRK